MGKFVVKQGREIGTRFGENVATDLTQVETIFVLYVVGILNFTNAEEKANSSFFDYMVMVI